MDKYVQLLKRARLDRGLTQVELARQAGIQQSTLAALESGKRVLTPDMRERLFTAAQLRPSIALEILRDEVMRSAAAHDFTNLRVFGSSVHGRDTPASDVDLLASFPSFTDLWSLAAVVRELSNVVGFPVDLVDDRLDEGDPVKEHILAEAVPL